MGCTPNDILEYVYNHELVESFLTSMMKHVGNYTIAEIADKNFILDNGSYRFESKGFNINVPVNDDDITTAIINKLYISAFLSRKDDSYGVHFLVHKYPESMKPKFEEEITKEVVRYMILHTIVALRLDTKEKIRKYCS